MERVEIYESVLPSYFICVTDAPAESVEHGHDHAAGENQHPGEHQNVGDEDEDHAGWKNNGSVLFIQLVSSYLRFVKNTFSFT